MLGETVLIILMNINEPKELGGRTIFNEIQVWNLNCMDFTWSQVLVHHLHMDMSVSRTHEFQN